MKGGKAGSYLVFHGKYKIVQLPNHFHSLSPFVLTFSAFFFYLPYASDLTTFSIILLLFSFFFNKKYHIHRGGCRKKN